MAKKTVALSKKSSKKASKKTSKQSTKRGSKNLSRNLGFHSDEATFSVVFLNLTDNILNPISTVFYEHVKNHKRLAIVGLDKQKIFDSILSVKDDPYFTEAQLCIMNGNSDVSAAVQMQVIQKQIRDFIAENERFLADRKDMKNFDLLDYWQKNEKPPEPVVVVTPKGGKEKGKKAPPTPKKGKIVKPVKNEIPIAETPQLSLEHKIFTKIPKRGQTLNAEVFIEDSPVEGTILFIVLFGIYSVSLIEELRMLQLPIITIINLIPHFSPNDSIPKVMSSETKLYKQFWMKVEDFRIKDLSNPIGFIDVHVPILSKYEAEKNSTEICRQLSWLIYDIEDKKRQHTNYLDHMKIFNVYELDTKRSIEYFEKYITILNEIPTENQSVEIIFDAMLQQVAFNLPAPTEYTESYVEPIVTRPESESEEALLTSDICLCSTPTVIQLDTKLLFPWYSKLIIDYSDKMLQNDVTVDADLNLFRIEEKVTDKSYGLDRVWLKYPTLSEEESDQNWIFIRKLISRFKAGILLSEFIFTLQLLCFMRKECKKDCGCNVPEVRGLCLCYLLEDTNEARNINEYHYVEPFTLNSFKQKLQSCEISYDNKSEEYFPYSDVILLKFWNNKRKLIVKNYINVITTNLCFRDYIKYVEDEITEWRDKQEKLYEEYLINKKRWIEIYKNPDVIESDVITEKDFLLSDSIKKLKLEEQLQKELEINIEEMDELNADKKLSKKSPKSSKISVNSKKSLKNSKSSKSIKSSKSTKSTKSTKSVKSAKSAKSGKSSKAVVENLDVMPTFRTLIQESDKCFNAYSIDERRFQVDTTETTFRSYILSIKVLLEKFLYRNNFLYIKVQQNRTVLYVNQIMEKNMNTVNVECFNGIRIFADVKNFLVSFSLPNGLKITTTPDMEKIDQNWYGNSDEISSEEIRRSFYKNGCVVIYYKNQNVKVLTSTGMIYESKMASGLKNNRSGSIRSSAGLRFQSGDNVSHSNLEKIYQLHIQFFEFLTNEKIDTNEFKILMPDGNHFLIKNKRIINILPKIMVRESFDYFKGEILVRRQDGVMLIYGVNKLVCLYPDGTVITTDSFDNQFIEDFHFDDISMPSFGSSGDHSNDSQSSSTNFIPPIINQITKFASSEHFLHITRNFQFQHAKYVSVGFKNDSNEVSFAAPGNISIDLCKNSIFMNLEDDVSLFIDEEATIFQALHCKQDDRLLRTKINFKDPKEFLIADDGYNNFFHINTNGDCSLDESTAINPEFFKCPKCNFNEFHDERFFVLKRNLEGYELLKKNVIDAWKKSNKQFSVINEEANGNLITLHPYMNFSDTFLLNFKIRDGFDETLCKKVYKCEKELVDPQEALQLLPKQMLMRCFLAASNRCNDFVHVVLRLLYDKSVNADELPEIDNFYPEILKKENFIDLIDAVEILEVSGKRTIGYYIEMCRKKISKIEAKKHPKPPSEKLLLYLEKKKEKKLRMAIYHKMLRENIIPKYFDFYEAGSHIKFMDLSKYEPVKKVEVQKQIKTNSCICICKCSCNKKVDTDICSIPTYSPSEDDLLQQ